MRILFVASQLYFPQLYGGVQTSTDDLCHALIERGHKVALLVKVMPGGWFGLKARIAMKARKIARACPVTKDTALGYPVWRSWFPADAVEYVCQKEQPDLIVIMTGGKIMEVVPNIQKTGIPVLVQLHDVAFHEYGDEFRQIGDVPYIANSRYTAAQYSEMYGIACSVVHPFISAKQYETDRIGENVTFVNPVSVKGLNIALEVARSCSDIPFTFVEGWTLSPEDRRELNEELAKLPNVTLLPSHRDMSAIYRKCKILLVPSIYNETFGRVTVEAQANGIPVVASNRGGLPEAVGSGGVLIDPDGPLEAWIETVERLWRDDTFYDQLSKASFAETRRPEREIHHQTDIWERIFQEAIAG